MSKPDYQALAEHRANEIARLTGQRDARQEDIEFALATLRATILDADEADMDGIEATALRNGIQIVGHKLKRWEGRQEPDKAHEIDQEGAEA